MHLEMILENMGYFPENIKSLHISAVHFQYLPLTAVSGLNGMWLLFVSL